MVGTDAQASWCWHSIYDAWAALCATCAFCKSKFLMRGRALMFSSRGDQQGLPRWIVCTAHPASPDWHQACSVVALDVINVPSTTTILVDPGIDAVHGRCIYNNRCNNP